MSHPTLYSVLEAEKKSNSPLLPQVNKANFITRCKTRNFQQPAFDPARLLSGFGSNALRLQQPSFINHTLMGNNQLVSDLYSISFSMFNFTF